MNKGFHRKHPLGLADMVRLNMATSSAEPTAPVAPPIAPVTVPVQREQPQNAVAGLRGGRDIIEYAWDLFRCDKVRVTDRAGTVLFEGQRGQPEELWFDAVKRDPVLL